MEPLQAPCTKVGALQCQEAALYLYKGLDFLKPDLKKASCDSRGLCQPDQADGTPEV